MWVSFKMGDPQVTLDFSTKSWSTNMDDFGYPQDFGNLHMDMLWLYNWLDIFYVYSLYSIWFTIILWTYFSLHSAPAPFPSRLLFFLHQPKSYCSMDIYIYAYILRRTINHGYLLTPDSFYCAVHCGVHKKRAARFPARALLGGSSKKVLVVVVHDPS